MSERKSEELIGLLCNPSFGHKGYALHFLIKEILTEKMETYTKRDSVSMTITQWCSELYTKWKVLKLFLEQYGERLGLEWQVNETCVRGIVNKSRSILIIKSPKLLQNLENRMYKNNKNYKNDKNYENYNYVYKNKKTDKCLICDDFGRVLYGEKTYACICIKGKKNIESNGIEEAPKELKDKMYRLVEESKIKQ